MNGLAGVVLPKAESPHDIDDLIGKLTAEIKVVALIESDVLTGEILTGYLGQKITARPR